MDKVNIWIRKAVAADVPGLQRLIEASVGELQAEDYTPAQREGALESVFGVDSQLIADGTYFVAEARIIDGLSDARETTEGINSGSHMGHSWVRRLEQTQDALWQRPLDGSGGHAVGPHTRRGEDSGVLHSSGVGAARRWEQDS